MDRNNRRGVTLIELLVAMSVSGFVLIAVLGIFGFSTRQFGAQTGRAETMLLANQAMNAMAKDIHNCISVQADATGILSVFTLPGNTDASGNYVPVMQNGTLTYVPGLQIHYRLSNWKGNASSGTNLWREYWQTGGLLGLGSSWTLDNAWTLLPGGSPKLPKFQNMSALTFSTTGMPANTVRVSLTMTDQEGGQASSYTVSRSVYLSNHN